MNLPTCAGLLVGDAHAQRDGLADGALRGLLDRAVVERLQRHLALHHLLLEHLPQRLQARLGLGVDLDGLLLELDRRVGALEVEPLRDLARGLVDRVANLLHVELGDDVEAGHGSARSPVRSDFRTACYCTPGSVPKWPKGTGCKPVAQASGVRIPPGPPIIRSVGPAARHHGDVDAELGEADRPVARHAASSARRPVHGGDVARSYAVDLADGRTVFAKSHPAAPAHFFTTEAAGLRWLRDGLDAGGPIAVPEVLAVSDDAPNHLVLEWIDEGGARAGSDAAGERRLRHRAGRGCTRPAPRASGARTVGPPGAGASRTTPPPTWAEFYAHAPAAAARAPRPRRATRCRRPRSTGSSGSPARLAEFGGADEPPARLHGDLWAGNRLVGADGRHWLVDPAAHGGHREFDLAMMRLFGGFGAGGLRRLRGGRAARAGMAGPRAAAPDRAARGARDQVRRRLRRRRHRGDRPLRLTAADAAASSGRPRSVGLRRHLRDDPADQVLRAAGLHPQPARAR